jgi:hypothetical protein
LSSLSPSTPGPTAQQQALQTEQATTNANLNLEENEQRKVILNAMQGTRVFRGSALSRQIASNTAGTGTPSAPPGVSGQQQNAPLRVGAGGSLLDVLGTPGGATPTVPAPGTNVNTGVGAGGGGGRGGIGSGR